MWKSKKQLQNEWGYPPHVISKLIKYHKFPKRRIREDNYLRNDKITVYDIPDDFEPPEPLDVPLQVGALSKVLGQHFKHVKDYPWLYGHNKNNAQWVTIRELKKGGILGLNIKWSYFDPIEFLEMESAPDLLQEHTMPTSIRSLRSIRIEAIEKETGRPIEEVLDAYFDESIGKIGSTQRWKEIDRRVKSRQFWTKKRYEQIKHFIQRLRKPNVF